MKQISFIIILKTVILFSHVNAGEIISFNLGYDYFLDNNINFNGYDLNNSGMSFAINLPINFQTLILM